MKGNQIFTKPLWRAERWVFGVVIAALFSCTRTAGDGGQAAILGIVEVEQRFTIADPFNFVLAPASDQDVYIIYGDRVGPDDRVRTNYDGEFAFYGLRPGDYTIYVYSQDTLKVFDKVAVFREATIEGRDEEVNIGTIRIYED